MEKEGEHWGDRERENIDRLAGRQINTKGVEGEREGERKGRT